MYSFERTFDMDFVTECLTSPSVWRMSKNDLFKNVEPELFFISDKLPFYYLNVEPGYGVLIGEPVDLDVYEVHVALMPKARGEAISICTQAIKWFFDNENCQKLTASIPSFNHHAMRLAKHCGFSMTGKREKAFAKDGKNYDLHLFEITRRDICQQSRQ